MYVCMYIYMYEIDSKVNFLVMVITFLGWTEGIFSDGENEPCQGGGDTHWLALSRLQGLRAKDLDTIGIAINKNMWSLYLRVMIDLIDNRCDGKTDK